MKGTRIKHDLNEPPPPLPGETLFAMIVTIITQLGLLFGLRLFFDFSYLTAVFCAVFIVIGGFLIGRRMDGKR